MEAGGEGAETEGEGAEETGGEGLEETGRGGASSGRNASRGRGCASRGRRGGGSTTGESNRERDRETESGKTPQLLNIIASFPDSTPKLFIAPCIKAGREPGTFRHATCISAVT